jgi:hypothetical protein
MTDETRLDAAAPGRRRFLAGATVGTAAAFAATLAGPDSAEAKVGDVHNTPITDTLTESEIALLTPKARTLTELEVILHNWSEAGHTKSKAPELSEEDVKSLEKAFVMRNRRLWGIEDEQASLAPGLVDTAHAGTTACCCCPASCCCASVDARPVRTRRIIA